MSSPHNFFQQADNSAASVQGLLSALSAAQTQFPPLPGTEHEFLRGTLLQGVAPVGAYVEYDTRKGSVAAAMASFPTGLVHAGKWFDSAAGHARFFIQSTTTPDENFLASTWDS